MASAFHISIWNRVHIAWLNIHVLYRSQTFNKIVKLLKWLWYWWLGHQEQRQARKRATPKAGAAWCWPSNQARAAPDSRSCIPGGSYCMSMCKASESDWQREKPHYCFQSLIEGEARGHSHKCTINSNMAAGGVCCFVSLTWEKGWIGWGSRLSQSL